MSYCRFENTWRALKDCTEHMDDSELSAGENRYRELLLGLIRDIALDYCDVVEDENTEDDCG